MKLSLLAVAVLLVCWSTVQATGKKHVHFKIVVPEYKRIVHHEKIVYKHIKKQNHKESHYQHHVGGQEHGQGGGGYDQGGTGYGDDYGAALSDWQEEFGGDGGQVEYSDQGGHGWVED